MIRNQIGKLSWKMIAKWLGWLMAGLLTLVLALIFIPLFFFTLWEAILYIFYPIELPVSAQISKFDGISFEYRNLLNNNCVGKSDISGYDLFPFELSIRNPRAYSPFDLEIIKNSETDKPNVFDFAANNGHLKFSKYVNSKQDSVVNEIDLTEKHTRVIATIHGMSGYYPTNLSLDAQICAQNITIDRNDYYYPIDVGFSHNSYKAVKTAIYIEKGDTISITLDGPINFVGSEQTEEIIDKLEIEFTATDPATVYMGVEGQNIHGAIFWVSAYLDLDQNKHIWAPGNNFKTNPDGMTIKSPAGKVQFGSYPEMSLFDSLTESVGELFEIPQRPPKFSETVFPNLEVKGDFGTQAIEVSGEANHVVYRKQPYGKSRWSQLPGYVQTGIFGLILGALPAWWGFVRTRKNKETIENGVPDFQPKDGSFICVLDSGYMIAGILVKEPGFWSPYYVIRDVRRKRISEKNWELETIPQINIKASRVEQYYFKGK